MHLCAPTHIHSSEVQSIGFYKHAPTQKSRDIWISTDAFVTKGSVKSGTINMTVEALRAGFTSVLHVLGPAQLAS